MANPCPPVSNKALKDDALGETVFYASTVRRDKQLQICAQGETVTYVYTTQGTNGLPVTQLRRFSLNNVAWVYAAKRMTTGRMLSIPAPVQSPTDKDKNPALVGLILYEQSIEYDIMTGNNFNAAFTTLVIKDHTTRKEKVSFDQTTVVNNIVVWSQKHHVRKISEPQW